MDPCWVILIAKYNFDNYYILIPLQENILVTTVNCASSREMINKIQHITTKYHIEEADRVLYNYILIPLKENIFVTKIFK